MLFHFAKFNDLQTLVRIQDFLPEPGLDVRVECKVPQAEGEGEPRGLVACQQHHKEVRNH